MGKNHTTKSGKKVAKPKHNSWKNDDKNQTQRVVRTRSNHGQAWAPETRELQVNGKDMFKILRGQKQDGAKTKKNMSFTTFEAYGMLTKVSKKQTGDEDLTLRSNLLDLGLGSIVSSEEEMKSRFGRIDEMLGS